MVVNVKSPKGRRRAAAKGRSQGDAQRDFRRHRQHSGKPAPCLGRAISAGLLAAAFPACSATSQAAATSESGPAAQLLGPACVADPTHGTPKCLSPGTYGRVLREVPEHGLLLYEHCATGRLSENSIIFEIPGANYAWPTMWAMLEPLRRRLPSSVPELLVVNLEPCSWDDRRVSCIRVETPGGSRQHRLTLAPTVFEAVRREREQLQLSACIPVKITPSQGPILASSVAHGNAAW